MKYVVLVTAGLIVIFFGAYFGLRWLNNDAPSDAPQGASGPMGVLEEQVFTSADGSVSVTYPTAASIPVDVPSGPTQEWSIGATEANGVLLADIIIPNQYMPGTNLSEARFTIGRSADADEIRGCTAVQDNFVEKDEVEVDGYPFTKYEVSEAAAGNRYDSTVRRGLFDGDCYAIEYTIHSTNIANFPVEQGVREFDEDALIDILEDMAKSVKWNISSD